MNRKRITIAGVGIMMLYAAFRLIPGTTPGEGEQEGPAGAVAVEVRKITPSTITETISAVGTVEAILDVTVESETAGRVVAADFNTGDFVEKGQVLAVVDDELKAVAVQQAGAQVLAAETQAGKAARDLERAGILHGSGDISDAELESYRLAGRAADAQHQSAIAALKVAERQLADTRIRAPIAGLVTAKLVERGEMVRSGKQVANIVDLRKAKVRLSVPENDVVRLRTGQVAVMELDSRPGVRFAGKVLTIGSKSESPTGHTYPVEVVIENHDTGQIRAGMFARVEITANRFRNAIAVPKEWILNEETAPFVYVMRSDTAREVPVRLGVRTGDSVQVLGGLSLGDMVISFGNRNLTDGTPVRYKEAAR